LFFVIHNVILIHILIIVKDQHDDDDIFSLRKHFIGWLQSDLGMVLPDIVYTLGECY
jgi:hypothetical protein